MDGAKIRAAMDAVVRQLASSAFEEGWRAGYERAARRHIVVDTSAIGPGEAADHILMVAKNPPVEDLRAMSSGAQGYANGVVA